MLWCHEFSQVDLVGFWIAGHVVVQQHFRLRNERSFVVAGHEGDFDRDSLRLARKTVLTEPSLDAECEVLRESSTRWQSRSVGVEFQRFIVATGQRKESCEHV